MKAALIMLMLAVPGFAQEPRVSEEEPSVESKIREWRETYLSTKNESSRERIRLCFNFPDQVRAPGFFFWPSDRFKDGCKNYYSPPTGRLLILSQGTLLLRRGFDQPA